MTRFLDDIFLIFQGNIENLHKFFEEINLKNPTIKFTIAHTTPNNCQVEPPPCPCPTTTTIPYLDTACKIEDRQLVTEPYRKPTDKNQYLLYSSCHPPQCLKAIPYSLYRRINIISCEETSRDRSFQELKDWLIEREYPTGVIDAAIAKARAIPRSVALRRVPRQNTNSRPALVVCFDPRLPSIPKIFKKHLKAMKLDDNNIESVFLEPPLVSYKRLKNI